VAYLTHSQYGRNGNEITSNIGNYTTGNASIGSAGQTQSAYNTEKGMLASTSGNIYGIYDLSGAAQEKTAAWDTESTSSNIEDYGSSFASKKGESTKYATAYHNRTNSAIPTSENCILGDATYEVNVKSGGSRYAWFSDSSYCAYSSAPFFSRGWSLHDHTEGVFVSEGNSGDEGVYLATIGYDSFRVVMPRRRGTR